MPSSIGLFLMLKSKAPSQNRERSKEEGKEFFSGASQQDELSFAACSDKHPGAVMAEHRSGFLHLREDFAGNLLLPNGWGTKIAPFEVCS